MAETSPAPRNHFSDPHVTRLGISNMPPEIRNEIYRCRLLFSTSGGKRKLLTVHDFAMRYRVLLPFISASEQLKHEMRQMFFGNNLLHLNGTPFGQFRFANSSPSTLQYSMLDTAQDQYWGASMELPPRKWRHLFKFVKITLHAPPLDLPEPFNLVPRFSQCIWAADELDWLFPLREIHRLGFGQLEMLEIEVLFPRYEQFSIHKTLPFGRWTREAIQRMHLNILEKKLSFELEHTG